MSKRLRVFHYANGDTVRVSQAEYDRKVRAQAAAAARWGKVRVQRSDGAVDILTPAQAARRERRREAAREGHRRRRIRQEAEQRLERRQRGQVDVDDLALGGVADPSNPWVIVGRDYQIAEGSDARDLIRGIIEEGRDAYFGRVDGTVSVVLTIDGEIMVPVPIGVVRDGEATIVDGRWRDQDELARANDWRPRILAMLQDVEDARYNRAAMAAAMMPGAFVSQLEGADPILPGDVDQAAQTGGRDIAVHFDLVFDPI